MILRTKIVLLGAGAALAVGVLVCAGTAYRNSQATERHLAELEVSLRDSFDRSARAQVETATSMLAAVAARADRGELTPEQARKDGADLLRSLRFGDDNYFWADTYDGVNVVLLGKPVEGKSRIDAHDANGLPVVSKLIENGRKPGGGFTDYVWPRAQGSAPLPKRAYTVAFEPFGWVIGAGNYVDDIDQLVQAEREKGEAEARSDRDRHRALHAAGRRAGLARRRLARAQHLPAPDAGAGRVAPPDRGGQRRPAGRARRRGGDRPGVPAHRGRHERDLRGLLPPGGGRGGPAGAAVARRDPPPSPSPTRATSSA
ncbi:MAG: cache domain-containing protein [Anaeromyxobacter sp.]